MLMTFYCCQNGSSREEDAALSSSDAYYGIVEEPVTIIHPLHGGTDPNGLTKTLQEIQPQYVVLYDVDMQFVRELEVRTSLRLFSPLNQPQIVQSPQAMDAHLSIVLHL